MDLGDFALAASDIAALAIPGTPLPIKVAAAGHLINSIRRIW